MMPAFEYPAFLESSVLRADIGLLDHYATPLLRKFEQA